MGVFEKSGGSGWVMNSDAGWPFPCPALGGVAPGLGNGSIPKSVLTAWGMSYADNARVSTTLAPATRCRRDHGRRTGHPLRDLGRDWHQNEVDCAAWHERPGGHRGPKRSAKNRPILSKLNAIRSATIPLALLAIIRGGGTWLR